MNTEFEQETIHVATPRQSADGGSGSTSGSAGRLDEEVKSTNERDKEETSSRRILKAQGR